MDQAAISSFILNYTLLFLEANSTVGNSRL